MEGTHIRLNMQLHSWLIDTDLAALKCKAAVQLVEFMGPHPIAWDWSSEH